MALNMLRVPGRRVRRNATVDCATKSNLRESLAAMFRCPEKNNTHINCIGASSLTLLTYTALSSEPLYMDPAAWLPLRTQVTFIILRQILTILYQLYRNADHLRATRCKVNVCQIFRP